MKRLLFIAILGMLLVACVPAPTCPPCPTCEPTPTVQPTATPIPWDVKWDARLDQLNVSIDWTDSEDKRYWPVALFITTNGSWDDTPRWAWDAYIANFPEAGGDHNVFGRCEDVNGNIIVNKTFLLSWPDGSADRTPEGSGWANLPIWGGAYYPDQGQVGPYSLEALNGLPVRGIGMPYNQHVSFFVVWRARW